MWLERILGPSVADVQESVSDVLECAIVDFRPVVWDSDDSSPVASIAPRSSQTRNNLGHGT